MYSKQINKWSSKQVKRIKKVVTTNSIVLVNTCAILCLQSACVKTYITLCSFYPSVLLNHGRECGVQCHGSKQCQLWCVSLGPVCNAASCSRASWAF